jgi:hypothetical protein
MPRDRRRPTRAAYGADYTRNLRWGYRPGHGAGSNMAPYLGGGSFGQGYGRAWITGPRSPRTPYDEEYRPRGRSRRRPGTAARDYDRAYPYFGSAAAMEGAEGYPPGDTLVPETRPRRAWPPHRWYDEEFG